MRRIGFLTGGGDAPGLNAVIRAVVRKVKENDIEVFGLLQGWKGALTGEGFILKEEDVEDIHTLGGTIIQSSRTNVYKTEDGPAKVRETMNRLGLECIVAIGGDDTIGVANKLQKDGMNMVAVPKTIDNDLSATDSTFGFDTAVNIAADAIDRLHTTAKSHSRILVVETMGRYTGWIALTAGMASGAHYIAIPEFPVTVDDIVKTINERKAKGKKYSIVVVSEGCKFSDLPEETAQSTDSFGHVRLVKREIGPKLAEELEARIGMEARAVVLGHLQRGGTPTAFDRVLGTKFGLRAAELVIAQKYGYMVALKGNNVIPVQMEEAVATLKKVDEELYNFSGTFFG